MQAYRLPLVTLFFALLSLVPLLPAVHAHDQLVSRHQHARMIKLWGPPPAARRDLLDNLGLGGGQDSPNGASNGAGGAGNVAAAPSPSAGGSGSASAPGGTASSPNAGAGAPTSSAAGAGASPSAPADTNGGGAAPGDGNTGGNAGDNNNNGGGIGGIVGSLTSGVGNIITGGGTTPPATPTGSQSTQSGSATNTGTQSQTSTTTQLSSSPVAPASPVSGADSSSTLPTVDTPPATQSSQPVTTPLTPQQQQQDESQTRIPKSTQVILIAVGSSVVGAAIIWTLIRKWKFRATRNRLATIDWSPDNSGDNMEDRQRLSFISQRSGSGSGTDAQSQFRRNMFAPDGPSLAPDFPPPHDFTAGPVRGGTPQPGLQRGYSGNRGQYGY